MSLFREIKLPPFCYTPMISVLEYNIRIKSFAHVGDGNVHIYILKDQLENEAWKQQTRNYHATII